MPPNASQTPTNQPPSEAENLSHLVEVITKLPEPNSQSAQTLYAIILSQAANGLVDSLVKLSEQLGEQSGRQEGHQAELVAKLDAIIAAQCTACSQHEECLKRHEIVNTEARSWLTKAKTAVATIFVTVGLLTALAEFKGHDVYELIKLIWKW